MIRLVEAVAWVGGGALVFILFMWVMACRDEKKRQNERELRERMEAIAKREVSLSGGLTWEQLRPFIERTNAIINKVDPPKRRSTDVKHNRRKGDKK